MRFYHQPHRFYCGVDLHARNMFTHILDDQGSRPRGEPQTNEDDAAGRESPRAAWVLFPPAARDPNRHLAREVDPIAEMRRRAARGSATPSGVVIIGPTRSSLPNRTALGACRYARGTTR